MSEETTIEKKVFEMPKVGTYVEVKPLPVKKWHGKSGKEDISAPKIIEVLFDPATGKYATGLTPEEKDHFENLLSLDLSDTFKMGDPHPYWSTRGALIKLPRETVVFDISRPIDYIKVKNMKASIIVANSMKEWKAGLFPNATHYIHDEAEAVSIEATKVQQKNNARKVAFELSLDEKQNMVRILSDKSVKGRSQEFIEVELDKVIEASTKEFMRYANMDKSELTVRAKILECLDRNILTKQGIAIYYMGDKIGIDMEDTVKFFMDPQNQLTKVAIFEKLEAL